MRFAAVFALLAAGFAACFFLVTRRPSPEVLARDFEAAWENVGSRALGAFFSYGFEGQVGRAMQRELARRAWLRERPGLRFQKLEELGDQLRLHFVTENDAQACRIVFEAASGRWTVRGVDLPPLRPGPLEGAATRFEDAWSNAELEALFSLFEADARSQHEERLRAALRRRAWIEARPRIQNGQLEVREDRAFAAWKIDGDELRVRFEWWKPAWRVTHLRLPPRD